MADGTAVRGGVVAARAETGKAPFLVSLVDSHKAFSKKPIRAIEVLEDLKLMLSLTGRALSPSSTRPPFIVAHPLNQTLLSVCAMCAMCLDSRASVRSMIGRRAAGSRPR
jgi:hypothetical protein